MLHANYYYRLHQFFFTRDGHAFNSRMTRYKELVADLTSACSAASRQLDYIYFCDEEVKMFQHNSGEPLFPFTEFQSCIPSCARAAEDICHELNQKNCIMEGIRRWLQCLTAVKLDSDIKFTTGHSSIMGNLTDSQQSTKFKVIYCNSTFECCTNISYFMELNQSSNLN